MVEATSAPAIGGTGRRITRAAAMKSPDPTDVHVGERLRLRRQLSGMSQQTLARGVALTFQQIQKYEKGTNRIAPRRLQLFVDAYNRTRRLKTLRGLTPFELIHQTWTREPDRFRLDPSHLIPGPYTSSHCRVAHRIRAHPR